MKNDDPRASESSNPSASNNVGPISLPAGELTISSALEHLGHDRFDELLAEFDWDAELTNDGDDIVTYADPRNQSGKAVITSEFLSWLKSEAAMASNAKDAEVDENDSQNLKQ